MEIALGTAFTIAWLLCYSAARSNRISDEHYHAFDQRRLDELSNKPRYTDPFMPVIATSAVSTINPWLLKDTTGRYLCNLT